MLVTVEKTNSQTTLNRIVHAVVLEACLPDAFQLRNSYESDPTIIIPRNRRTSLQNYIRNKSEDFNLPAEIVEKKFHVHSGVEIEWDTPKEWILLDEGYSLEFKLKTC